MKESNKSISFINGGTKLLDLDEGNIYKYRNIVKLEDWHKTVNIAQEWINTHIQDVNKFKKKFRFTDLQEGGVDEN